MRRLGRAVLIGVGVAALAAWMGRGAHPVQAADREAAYHAQASGSAAPTIQVYSRETVVDVMVTDKDGKPVRGLTKADFSVTEDDKPQPIRSFKEFDRATPADTSTPRKLPQNTYSNVQAGTGPLYVLLNGGKWAAQFLKNLPSGTRVAQIGGVGRLTVLQGSTEPALRPGMVIGINPIKIPPGLRGCELQVLLDWQTLDMLNELATYLAGIQGRKNLIWIGGDMSDLVWNGCQLWDGPRQQTYDLLEDAQITMYPVDPSGVVAPPGRNASGPPSSYGEQAATQNADWLTGLAKDHLSMEAVAEATGGQAFYNANDIAGAIAKAADAGASYYTLSYAPAHSVEYDGKYHAISVKVNRPDVHALYRKGYSAEDPALIEHPPETLLGFVTRDTRPTGAAADPFVAAMSPMGPPATQLLFDVRVEPSTEPVKPTDPVVMGFLDAKLKNAPLTRYGFLYSLPADQIAFADEAGGNRHGALELDVVAYDSVGNVVSSLRQAIDVTPTGDQATQSARSPLRYFLQLDLPTGRMHLRVGVLDKVSNKVGTVEVPVTVAKGTGAVVAGR